MKEIGDFQHWTSLQKLPITIILIIHLFAQTRGKYYATGRANAVHICLHVRILRTAPADQQPREQKCVFNNILNHADMKLQMPRMTRLTRLEQ